MLTLAIIPLICLIVSVIFAVFEPAYKSPSLWALWGILAALIFGAIH